MLQPHAIRRSSQCRSIRQAISPLRICVSSCTSRRLFFFFLHFVLLTVVGNRNVFPLPFLSVSHCNMSISFLPFFYSASHKSFHCWFSFLTIQIRTIFLSHFPSFFPPDTPAIVAFSSFARIMAFIKISFFLFAVVFYFFCNSSMLFPVMFVLQFSFFFSSITSCICFVFCIFFLLLGTFLCLHRSVHFFVHLFCDLA